MPKSLNLTNVALEEPLLPWFEADEVRNDFDVFSYIVSFVLTKRAFYRNGNPMLCVILLALCDFCCDYPTNPFFILRTRVSSFHPLRFLSCL